MTNNSLGSIEIKPQALAVIVSIAVNEVEGVSKLVGSLKSTTLEKIGKKEYSKGVKLSLDGDDINVEIFCNVKTSYQVANVAKKIQENVRNSVYNMTELDVKSVNVNIVGVDY